MSFQESIIIPLSLFKKCRIAETVANGDDLTRNKILGNPQLHPSEKIGLYNQANILERSQKKVEHIREKPIDIAKEDDELLIGVQEKYKPYGKSIIDFIRKNPDDVGWDEQYRIRIKGWIIPNSNLNETLKHFMRNTIVTKESDIPPGTNILSETLFDLGIPKTWFPQKRAAKTGRKRARVENIDSAGKWDSY